MIPPSLLADMHDNLNRSGKRLNSKGTDGYRSNMGGIWLQSALNKIIETQQVAVALTPMTELTVINQSALQHGYKSMRELATAAYSAVQGESRKAFNAAVSAATTAVLSGALSADVFSGLAGATAAFGIKTFGWRVRITASQLNFAFRPVQIDVGPLTGNAGPAQLLPTPVLSLAIVPRRLPVDVVILSPANSAGLFTLVPGSVQSVVGTTGTTDSNGVAIRSLSDATAFAAIESLNMRDLTSRLAEGNLPKDEAFGGMRDASY